MKTLRSFLLLVAMAIVLLWLNHGIISDNSREKTEKQRDIPSPTLSETIYEPTIYQMNLIESKRITHKNYHHIYMADLNITNLMDLPTPLPFLNDTKNPCFYDNQDTLRCLPYFFILASQKSGTTDIHSLLSTHKDIVSSITKEPHWFNRERFGGYPKPKLSQKWIIESMNFKSQAVPFTWYLDNFNIDIGHNSGR